MRSAAIYVGPDFVSDRWQHFRLQLRLNVVNLEYLTIYICETDRQTNVGKILPPQLPLGG